MRISNNGFVIDSLNESKLCFKKPTSTHFNKYIKFEECNIE